MSRGFSLIEVLVATTILVAAVAGLAPSFTIASRANRTARTTTVSALLAQQKMEQLRALTWGFGPFGEPQSDTTTDLTVAPAARTGGTGLSPSPAGALGQDTAGFCDFIDGSGNVLGGGTMSPSGSIYTRRWSIDPLTANPNNTLVLQVLVTRSVNGGTAPLPDAVRLASIRTRKAF